MSEKQKRLSIIRSETWLGDSLKEIQEVLDSTIDDFTSPTTQILNIERHKEASGLNRFWIYIID